MSTSIHRLRRPRFLIGFAAACLLLACALLVHGGVQQALSAGLSPVETRVFGQSRWLCGGPAGLRVIVTDHRTGNPLNARVNISLKAKGAQNESRVYSLYSGETNRLGTVDAQFTAPKDEPGAYDLRVGVATSLGQDEVLMQVQLDEAVQVMLTADKPLYQPGQTMHLRALALDMATRAAVSGDKLTFEVEDARGNKVFKESPALSKFGIAAADFTLADEVNMGTYTLRAILPTGQTEKKVRVERYVLPKFKVALTTDRPFYLPGETVKGTVQSDYFFGKPVAGGAVTVQVVTVDIGVTKLAELTGKTDANGTYKFEYTLPNSFVGQPFEQGKAVVDFHGIITDTANHVQEVNTTLPVVKDPILLAIVPESASLVPGISNRVFIAAATPDGTPLKNARLTVTRGAFPAEVLTTDEMGLAMYAFTPAAGDTQLTVTAKSEDGRTITQSQTLGAGGTDGIIVRTSKSLVKVGDRINLAAASSRKGGTVYFDIIRNKQTILTKAVSATKAQDGVPLTITHDMIGTLEVHAYKILPNEDIIRDTQVLVVMPADDLVINVKANQTTYRPGEEAVLNFSVTDQQRHPILAALGLAIVDESVFALSELQPGLEKIYFTLEKELMEPKYEIHGLTPVDLILDPPMPGGPVRPILLEDARQRAAEVLFAAVPGQGQFDVKVNTYQQRWEKMKGEVIQEMVKTHQKIVQAIATYRQKTNSSLTAEQTLFHLVDTGYLKLDDLKDRWGNFYKSDLGGQKNYDNTWFTLSSAGPDGAWGTIDDVTGVNMYGNRWGMRGFKGGDVMFEAADGLVMMADKAAGGPMPMMAPMAMRNEAAVAGATTPTSAPADAPAVRIREYFPETMYWNPALITNERGEAQLRIPMADSITTWRMSMTANSARGQLGSATAPLRVFQDFFVDIDLPVSLTQHDHVSIPVAVYNYLDGPQDVSLTLEPDAWYTLDGPNEKLVHMGKDDVKVVYFPITVTGIGRFPLTIHAQGTKLSDAIRRSIDVLPDGKEVRTAINDRLEGKVAKTVTIPADAIDGASTVWVKLYPGAFSQVVEGLDGILRMPGGCFEQTSSSAYPNVLVLDYLKKMKKVNPELQMKAEQYINVGYQRLVTFECKGGGFSWFGDEPAHQILTAYGLLEFSDMAKVHEVDPNLIARTQQWLAARQKPDGTWEEKNQGIAEGIINRQTGALRSTAYIAWALAESGYQGPQLAKGVQYVKAHRTEATDPYTLAVILNLLTRVERDSDVTAAVAADLIKLAKVTEKTAYWESDTKTFTGATQQGADLETSGMAAFGLAKWGRNSTFTTKVLTHLVQSKDSFGTWSSTQGTVWSLKALLFASTNATGGGKGKVVVTVNGETAQTFTITEADSDVMRQVDLGTRIKEGGNAITLQYDGDGSLLYQIVGRYYLPWNVVERQPAGAGPLAIDVAYDKTTLATDDTATVTVTVKNVTAPRAVVEMPLIDIGLPPGFTLVPEKLENAVTAKKISKFTVAARQIIVYLEKLGPGETVTLTYQIKAKYPIKARTPQSVAYPYYNPERAVVSAPQQITVAK